MALKRCIDKECITTWASGDHCPKCGLAADVSKIAPKHVASKTELAAELSDDTEFKPSNLRWLPMAFYIIACLGFSGWILIAINLESWEAFGYGIGATIACLGSGRVIELLQIIADELQQKRLSESP